MISGSAMLQMQMLGISLAGIHAPLRLDIRLPLASLISFLEDCAAFLHSQPIGSMPLAVKRSCLPHCCLGPPTSLDRASHKSVVFPIGSHIASTHDITWMHCGAPNPAGGRFEYGLGKTSSLGLGKQEVKKVYQPI
ncbi:hypothetical protein LY78DRAFT_19271 [Colletotrichum sublineola]|nr:hypothetical protein LY78DRAFT_19271 [Colletotrichum sublineola]